MKNDSHKEYTQLEAATVQLERACSLYIDGSDYLSAITLAGAADLLLGLLLEKSRPGEAALRSAAKVYAELAQRDTGAPVSNNEAIGEINLVRDWLKHGTKGPLSFDARLEAYALIDRAIINFIAVTGSETSLMQQFRTYAEREGDIEFY